MWLFNTLTQLWQRNFTVDLHGLKALVGEHEGRVVRLSSDDSMAAAAFTKPAGRQPRSILVWVIPSGPFQAVFHLDVVAFSWLPGQPSLLLLCGASLLCAAVRTGSDRTSVEVQHSVSLLRTDGHPVGFDTVPLGSAALVLQQPQPDPGQEEHYRLTLLALPALAQLAASTYYLELSNNQDAFPASVHCCDRAAAVCFPGCCTRVHALHPLWGGRQISPVIYTLWHFYSPSWSGGLLAGVRAGVAEVVDGADGGIRLRWQPHSGSTALTVSRLRWAGPDFDNPDRDRLLLTSSCPHIAIQWDILYFW